MRGSAFRVSTAVVGLIAAAAVAGCGGSSSSTSSSADFVAQGNAICKKSNAQVAAIPKPQTTNDLTTYFDKVVPIVDSAFAQLKGLTPPSDQQAAFDAWIASGQKEQDLIDQAKTAADSGDSAKAIALAKAEGKLNTANSAQAAALGLSECAKNSSSGSSGSSG